MVKCPKCKKAIDNLLAVVSERNLYTFFAGRMDFREAISSDVDYWKCPKCYAVLPIDADEASAEEFLAGAAATKIVTKGRRVRKASKGQSLGPQVRGVST